MSETQPTVRKAVTPDHAGFALAMLGNEAYRRVSEKSIFLMAVARIENFITSQSYEWQVLQMLWQQMTTGLAASDRATADEIIYWNEITEACQMPFSFNVEGLIEIDPTVLEQL